ncbi:hypothetical protein [Halostella litorea]|nr:hypothetical protein [Halostella litorea]
MCRYCDAPDADHDGRFCSDPCEVAFEHIRADAREARRDAQQEGRR